MCLSVSRLFWVSSLAYPNLLGTKGYVVVVVVVVVVDSNNCTLKYWKFIISVLSLSICGLAISFY
jgi:hypothetical protein